MTARETAGTLPAPFFTQSTAGTGAHSVGLSTCHISPRTRQHPRWTDRTHPITFKLIYAPESLLVKTVCDFGPIVGDRPWRRGAVKGLSKKSRARCVQVLATIPWKRLKVRPIFLTLTYPETWSGDWQDWKRHFDAFWKRLKRGWKYENPDGSETRVLHPHAACVWRLELQTRGAPHFHLIIFNVDWIHIPWLDTAWAEVVDAEDPNHERAGTSVEWPRKWKGTVAYVAKYVAKQAAAPARRAWAVDMDGSAEPVTDTIGRHWGVYGRDYLPQSRDEIEVDEETFALIKAVLVDERGDGKGEMWMRHPYRGIWGVCGPGPILPILKAVGLIDPDGR